jgi:hypothetical protein
MHRGKRLLRLSLVAVLAIPAEILAQNLVQNSSFNINLAGWTSFGPTGAYSAVWDSLDSGGSSVSGSALLTNSASGTSTSSGLFQCVPVVPNVSYVAAMKVRVPGAVASAGYLALQVNWFTGTNCSGMISPTSTQFIPPVDVWTAVRTSPLTAPANAATASVQPYIFKVYAGGTYQARVDDVTLMPFAVTLTLPASASIHGIPPTFFHTDLWIFNHSYTNNAVVTARHRCFTTQSCSGGTQTIRIAPRASSYSWNTIATWFGDPETSGAIELTFDPSEAVITAGSRTYTPTESPTNGAGIPALPQSEAKTRGFFWGLSANGGSLTSGFRSNAGAYNPNDTAVDVTFTMYDSSGSIAGSPWTRTFGPHEPYQVNIFNATGNGSVVTTNHYLVMTATAPVFGYVTVVDNLSGDQIFVNAADDQ